MINRRGKLCKLLSKFIIAMMLLSMSLPLVSQAIYAGEETGFTLTHEVLSSTVTPGADQIITVKLHYSTASTTDEYYNVKIQYTLPPGAVYKEAVRSGHVLSDSYDEATGTVTFEMGDNTQEDEQLKKLFPAGVSGFVEVKFYFPLPSVYPDGATIPLNPGVFSWNLNAPDGNYETVYSNTEEITYSLPASWIIEKSGPVTAVISNNPSDTELDVTYTISLSGGNINLKDVEIVDTLPPDATFKSSTISSINGQANTDTAGEVIWTIPDVTAGDTTSFDVTLTFAIDRGLGNGVVSTDSRTNTVTVTGYPIHIQEDGSFNKWNEQVVFAQNQDDFTTTFNQSTDSWGVETDGPNQVVLSLNPQVTEVEVDYTLGIDGGDMDMEEVFLNYQLPDDATVVDADGGTYDEGSHTITWDIGNLAGDSSIEKDVTVKYSIDRTTDGNGTGVSNGDARTNTVTATGKALGGGVENIIVSPGSADITTTFINSTAYWSVNKSGPGSVVLPHEGDLYIDVDYTLSLESNGEGNIPLSTVTLTEQLPQHATYQSANVEPSSNDGSTLTWEFTDVLPGNPPAVDVTIRYAVDRDGSGGVKPGDSLTNNVTVEAYPLDGDGEGPSPDSYVFGPGNGGDSVQTTFAEDDFPNPQLSLNIFDYNKEEEDKNFDIGDQVIYVIDFDNQDHNNEMLYDAVLTDGALPGEIDYTEIRLGGSSAAVDYTFEYQTNQKSWTAYGGTYNTDTEAVINISDLGLAVDEALTGIRISYQDAIPAGFQFTDKIQLKGTINDTAQHDTSIGNSASLDYRYRVFDAWSAVQTLSDSVSFNVLLDTAWISQLKKTKLTEGASFQHYTNSDVKFQLKVENHGRLATDDFHNPVLVDVVPAGFEYKGDDTWWSSMGASGLPAPQHFEQYDDYPEEGETTLIWSWDDGAVLKMGETIKLEYNLRIKGYAGVGTHTNQFFMYGTGAYLTSQGISIIADGNDLDQDADALELFLEGEHADINVRETSAINSYKWVQGELDDEFHKYPTEGLTAAGGSADYKLEVLNAGNTHLQDIEIIDILPYIGDTAVLSSTSRGSEWRPYLIEALEQGIQLPIVLDINNNQTNADIEIYYSTATDPIRKGQNNEDMGTQEPNWSMEPPQDITSVRSLKFVVKNFAENAKGLKPGSKAIINWKMRAPIGTPVEAMTWNSISMAGTTVSYDNSKNNLLPAEPNMVGIKVLSNPLGEIGDFVWFDKNGDGIQNDGYDQQVAGLNGIKVHLHQYREEGDVWEVVDTTLTGDNQSGNPGYYLFPNLEEGRYYVSFELPAFYTITSENSGGDGAQDSDGYDDSGVIRTEAIDIDVDDEDLRINHDLDLGLIAANPSLLLTKEAVGYKDVDGNYIPFNGTKAPVNAGETVVYRINVENAGNIPLHNICLEDVMENSGFSFTKASYDNAPDFTSLSLDSNIIFSEAEGNVLKIHELAIGKGYQFEAEYTVLSEDVDGSTLDNVIKVWANELNDQETPENPPYSQAEEKVDIAAMDLEKFAHQVKPVGQANFVDLENEAILGVEPGDTIKYKIVANNSGSADLENVTITDNKTGFTETIDLPAGTSKELLVDYVVKEADRPQVVNTAEAGHSDIRYTVEDNSTVNFKGLAIVKEVTAVNGEAPKEKDGKYYVNVGDEIEYTIRLTNTDNTKLEDVVITKDLLTTTRNYDSEPDLLLENVLVAEELQPGEEVTYPVYYTVQPGDVSLTGETKTIHNHVYGKSKGTFEKDAFAEVEIAHLVIDKTANKSVFRRSGEEIVYTIKVTNRGSIALSNVTIKDLMLDIDQIIENLLLPDNTSTITASYYATAEDKNSREIINTVLVGADEVSEQSDTCTVTYRRPSSPPPIVPPVPPEIPPEIPQENPEEPVQNETTPKDTPTGGNIEVPEGSIPSISDEPDNGEVTIDEGGNWEYTPNPGFTGKDKFSINITGDDGNTEEIIIEIDVEETPAGAPELPKTGQLSDKWFYLAGMLITLIGFIVRRKII